MVTTAPEFTVREQAVMFPWAEAVKLPEITAASTLVGALGDQLLPLQVLVVPNPIVIDALAEHPPFTTVQVKV
jgi:hypothetical protein